MSEEISESKTPAGIPVLTGQDRNSRSAGYMVAVRTGSRDEDPAVGGISHLLEHVVFRATKKYSSYQMAKEMEGAGGELNAFTGRETTAFYGITIRETADVAREMVADIVANPLIEKNDVELEKKIVLQELSMIESEPDSYIHDLFANNLWRGHPLSQDEGGSPDIVGRLDDKDLKGYYEERYGAPNLSVFAVGSMDPEEAVAWASESFDGMVGKLRRERSAPPVPKAGYFFKKNRSEHCHVAIGFPAYAPGHALRTASVLLGGVLGSGTSSRLFQEVREKRALVYSVHTMLDQSSDAGALCTFLSSTDENTLESVETVAKTFSVFRKEGLEKGELERTKRLIKGALVRAAESTERRMYMLARDYMLDGRPRTLAERLEAIDAVRDEDVMKAAGELMHADTLNITVLGKGNRGIRKFDLSGLDL
ncbi:MAG: insulinase family protein [Candidatus Methanoplasma sp.]|jgi:predicted Zn-dependent peptidase|nr:insulinase family protein [Candidatus Methanoplasma sp.]